MRVIGITGNSGSGKSTVAKILNEKLINSIVIDADAIAKEMAKNTESDYYKEIVKKFGDEILILETKQIDRRKLAKIIFENDVQRKKLNIITYKYVVTEIKNKTNLSKNNNIIIDAPLLFEGDLDKICDITIAVIAKEKNKIDRICIRDNISENDAKKRIASQIKENILTKKCDYTIENDGNIEKIEKQIDEIILEGKES